MKKSLLVCIFHCLLLLNVSSLHSASSPSASSPNVNLFNQDKTFDPDQLNILDTFQPSTTIPNLQERFRDLNLTNVLRTAREIDGELEQVFLEYHSELGNRYELTQGAKNTIADMGGIIADKESVMGGIIADKESIIKNKEGIIAEMEGIIADKEGIIADKEGIIADKEGIIKNRDDTITKQLNTRSPAATFGLFAGADLLLTGVIEQYVPNKHIASALSTGIASAAMETVDIYRDKNSLTTKVAIQAGTNIFVDGSLQYVGIQIVSGVASTINFVKKGSIDVDNNKFLDIQKFAGMLLAAVAGPTFKNMFKAEIEKRFENG